MPEKERLLLVDGYNVLGAWPELARGLSFEDARDRLSHLLQDYAGYSGQTVVLVFDAWQSDRRQRTSERMGRLTVVFTQRGETADHYIERLCEENAHSVERGLLEMRVATSDGVEQTVILGRGASRLSARELIYEVNQARRRLSAEVGRGAKAGKSSVMDRMPAEVRERLEKLRRGEK